MRWCILIFLVLVLFLVSGQAGCVPMNLNDFLSGDRVISGFDRSGLNMQFIEEEGISLFSKSLGENDPFIVGIKLRNYSPYPLEGELCVNDLLQYRMYKGIPEQGNCKQVFLGGIKESSQEEYEKKIYFPSKNSEYYYSNLDDYFSSENSISASFKYTVSSLSTSNICIKGEIGEDLPGNIKCKSLEVLSGISNSPAPLIVDEIKKKTIPREGDMVLINLEIKLKKISEGEILDLDKMYTYGSYDPVVNYKVELGNEAINCDSGGELVFRETEKVIKCKTSTILRQPYVEDIIKVKLNYGFKKTISRRIELTKED